MAFFYVGSEFFSLYGIPLVRGRMFGTVEPEHSVIVGERCPQIMWPGHDPIGRTFKRAPKTDDAGSTPQVRPPTYQVVGLVREINFPSVDARRDLPEFYQPIVGTRPPSMLSIRCGVECPAVAMVRQRIAAASPAVRINRLEPADARYLEQLARPRATAALAFAFAVIAVLASSGGLFSVLSYTVNQRRKEFGIRSAIGASPREIRVVVLRDAVLVTAAGVLMGGLGAITLGRVLVSLQYGVVPSDPVSWLIVCSVLVRSGVLAACRPAHHAARVDALQLLREK